MKIVIFIFLILFLQSAWSVPTLDPNKRTVCAMTLNSDEEREVFRQEIAKDPTHFNPLVELTELGGSDWFQKACRSGIKCDQLIISGHFTDRFSGTADGVRRSLKLDDLEKAGCQNTCDNILDHPFEVFLLGCNTLATKAADNRTPQQYLQHLLEEGTPRSRAELITEARYGKFGDDNKSRIERAFRGQRKVLYGFDARGPSGATIEPMLKNYFKQTSLLRGLDRAVAWRITSQAEFANQYLHESLNATAFDMCSAGPDSMEDRRICAFMNPALTIDRKLEIMRDAFAEENWPDYVPTFNRFFRDNPPERMTDAQKNILSELSRNSVIGRQVRNLAQEAKYQAVRAEWNFFGRSVGFITGSRLDGILDGL